MCHPPEEAVEVSLETETVADAAAVAFAKKTP